jgi:hypothetical protein
MSGMCSFARASGLEASGVLAQFLAPDALEIARNALLSEEAWIRFLQPSSSREHAALRVRALLFDPSLPRACESSDAARVDPDGWGASLGSDVAGWARASVRLPHDDVYHTLEEDEEDWERARAAGALPSRLDRPDVPAPRAPSSHPAPRVRVRVHVLDDAARVRLSIAATEDPRIGENHPAAAASPAADASDPLVSAVARDDDEPTTRAWRGATARIRVARVDAARVSVADDERVSELAASRRPAPPPRTPAGMRAYLLGGDAARTTAEDVGRAAWFPELAGLRSTVPPFPSTTVLARPGKVSSEPVGAMSEADTSATLARVVAEALLRPPDANGAKEEPTVSERRRGNDEETATTTTTTMAAESAVVDALVAAAGNLARSIARRLRVALDARATRARTAARWERSSNEASAAPGVAPCVTTLAVRAATAGGEATPASLVAYRRRGALERGRLAARVAAAKFKAEENAAVKAVEAAAEAERPPATMEPTADPAPFASADFPSANALGFDVAFASRSGSPSVTLPLDHPGRVPSPHLPALDAFVLAKQPEAAAAGAASAGAASAASGGIRLAAEQLASLHAQFRAKGLQLTAADVRRYELLLQQQMAAMRHQDMGQGTGGGATAGAERMFAPPRPMSPGTHVVTGGKREGTAAGVGAAKRWRLE